jgi:thymidylate synthase
MMVAKVTHLEVGDFIHTFGDVHIYKNHIEQCQLQLTRYPYPKPIMLIKDRDNILDFTYEDFKLINYQHHPSIKGEISV